MVIFETIFGAIAFVLTAGFIGRDRFQKNPFLTAVVIVLSVVGTIGSVFVLKGWVLGLIDERLGMKAGPENPFESISSFLEQTTQTPLPSASSGVRPSAPQVQAYFTITDRLATKQVNETIDVIIDGVVQGTFRLDRTGGKASATVPFKVPSGAVQYALSGRETDTLEGFERERVVTGSGRIDDAQPGRRYEFQPVRPFTIAPGETPPAQIEEHIIPSR